LKNFSYSFVQSAARKIACPSCSVMTAFAHLPAHARLKCEGTYGSFSIYSKKVSGQRSFFTVL
jgi:hypothetical protein